MFKRLYSSLISRWPSAESQRSENKEAHLPAADFPAENINEWLATVPLDSLDWATAFAIKLRQSGHPKHSEALLEEILKKDTSNIKACYELALLYKHSARPQKALEMFKCACAIQPEDERSIRQVVMMSCYLSEYDGAIAALDHMQYNAGNIRFMNVALQFERYLRLFPYIDTKSRLESTISKHTYLSVDSLKDEIIHALKLCIPFSFIRLGDGEGARVRIDMGDEAAFGDLYDENRLYFNHIWFGASYDDSESRFGDLSRELWEVVRSASIVGIPYQSWIDHEFDICSTTGIVSLSNIVRMLDILDEQSGFSAAYCAQNSHFGLSRSGLFEEILSGPNKIWLISCYEKLPSALESRFGCKIDRFFKVPGENAYRGIIGDARDIRPHYPSVFRQIRKSLQSTTLAGHLVIVAAGYLGKFYCADVKKSGGIAIDVGSIADGWMDRRTRPGVQIVERINQKSL